MMLVGVLIVLSPSQISHEPGERRHDWVNCHCNRPTLFELQSCFIEDMKKCNRGQGIKAVRE
jgi:hypothetical protein